MNKKYDVVALGELLVDMAEGAMSDQDNLTFEACPGGAPCNVLAFLSQKGDSTAFIGKVGDDFLGHMLADTIRSVGIDSAGLVFDSEVKTTLAFVHKKENGDRDFSFYRNPGADMMLSVDEVNQELIKSTRIFHFGTLSMTDEPVKSATKRAVSIAKENGALVSFDPNLREPLWRELADAREAMLWGMSMCDILKISDNEVEFITGEKDQSKWMDAITKLTSARIVLITLGPDGSRAFAGGEEVYVPGVKMDSIVDTTGAGDTFFGSALHYIIKNGMELTDDKLKELLTISNSNASRITQVKGALKAMSKLY